MQAEKTTKTLVIDSPERGYLPAITVLWFKMRLIKPCYFCRLL